MSFSRFFQKVRSLGIFQKGNQSFLERLTDGFLLLSALFIPVWFLPFTLDPLDINKQTLFVAFTGLALLAWIGQGILTGSFTVMKSAISSVLLLFLAGYAAIAWFSQDRYAAFVGVPGQMQWSLVSVIVFVVFAFLVANRFRSPDRARSFLSFFLIGGLIASFYGALALLGFSPLPGDWSARTFNTVGSVGALALFCAFLMTLVLACWLFEPKVLSRWRQWLYGVVLGLGVVVLLAADMNSAWMTLLFGSVLVMAVPFVAHRRVVRPLLFTVPAVCVAVAGLFLWLASPLAAPVPADVSPSVSATWDIVWHTLRDRPLVGSGQGTWVIDYARYRPVDVNGSPFWSVLFEQGSSSALTLVAMVGVVGVTLVLLLLLFLFLQTIPRLFRSQDVESWDVRASVFVLFATVLFAGCVTTLVFTHLFVWWLLFGLLVGFAAKEVRVWSRTHTPRAMYGLSAAGLLLVVGAVAFGWLGVQRYVAEVVYAQGARMEVAADDAMARDMQIARFSTAAALNPFWDLYARGAAQGHLAAARAAFAGGAEDAQAKGEAHMASATHFADAAIARNPAFVVNWAHAAGVYTSLVHVVPGADQEAARRYQEALLRYPSQPAYLNAVGELSVFRADAIQQSLASLAETEHANAQAAYDTALQSAAHWFTQAVQVKPDYLVARVNLAMLQERMGSPEEAIASLTQILEEMPDAVSVRWFLGGVYERSGKREEAIAELQALAEAYPDNEDVAAKLIQLQDTAVEEGAEPSSDNPDIISPSTP